MSCAPSRPARTRFTVMADPALSLARRLADFACAATPDDAAGAVLRLSMLDWAAVAHAGRTEPVTRIMRDTFAAEGGAQEAHVLGLPGMRPARTAALINGATSHALDYDDTHFDHIGHPSVAVLPAALAVAERVGATGRALQHAALTGAELSIRLGTWLGRSHYQAGFHQTATAGAFGAATAAGLLLDLSPHQMETALAVCTTRASGLKAQFGTMGKPFNAGLAASNGVEAAMLAAHGFVSTSAALDGPASFAATHHGAASEAGFEAMGTAWRFADVKHKFHACCHGLHATLEALRDVGTAPGRVARIDVTTHPRWMSVCNIPCPGTGLEAKFSYAQVVALVLSGHDTARLDTFTDALCHDPQVARFRNRVTVTEDATLSELQAQVTVTDDAGHVERRMSDLDQPLPLDTRERRVRAKAAALIGQARADRLWHLITQEASARRIMQALMADQMSD
ncbi:MAG: MmgE/PrpD family protein [Pseudomonadota bacterium]